jgi:hypothetical protein
MREERKKRKSLRKIVECKPHSVENAPQPEDEVVTVSKPKENPYYRQILRLKKTIPNWDHLFNEKNDPEDRMNDWIRIEVIEIVFFRSMETIKS